MAAFGLLGLITAYLIFGKIDGDFIGLGTIFFPNNTISENPAAFHASVDAIRIYLSAGGVAGVISGLFVPSLSNYLK